VLVDEIIDAFKARFEAKVETVTTAEEAIAFLPRELRDAGALNGRLHRRLRRRARRLHWSYAIGALTSFKGIAEGVENSNYLVHTASGPYILTLYEKRVSREDLPYFLALMEHLAARGITCPLPVHDREGRTLKELAGRPAALITFLEGLWVRRPGIEHCAALGQALGRFHLAGQDFPMRRANSLSLPGWQALFVSIGSGATRSRPGLRPRSRRASPSRGHWPADLPQGVIHADLFPDNVFFLGDKVPA
jgi:homoserine kinase type II